MSSELHYHIFPAQKSLISLLCRNSVICFTQSFQAVSTHFFRDRQFITKAHHGLELHTPILWGKHLPHYWCGIVVHINGGHIEYKNVSPLLPTMMPRFYFITFLNALKAIFIPKAANPITTTKQSHSGIFATVSIVETGPKVICRRPVTT